jgi:hypothetical protein
MTQNLVKGHKAPVDKGLCALGPMRAQTHYLFTFIHSRPPGLGPVPTQTTHIIFTHIPLLQCQIVCVTDNDSVINPLVLDLNAWCILQTTHNFNGHHQLHFTGNNLSQYLYFTLNINYSWLCVLKDSMNYCYDNSLNFMLFHFLHYSGPHSSI